MGDIVWPACLSFVAVSKPTTFFSGIFSSGEVRVFSISGGQLQHSYHPALAKVGANGAATQLEGQEISRSWDIKNLTTLDGFAFDPRDKGCTGHGAVKGGLLGATLEIHSDTELTINVKMDSTPLRIAFLSKDVCDAFVSLVEEHKNCCQQKFHAQMGERVAAMKEAAEGQPGMKEAAEGQPSA
mmetsp:Transcript_52338/g.106709  ORF Transcript_52338/g.106709 Transcript_52338/m.106709 type:complete len:184 (+) Transcript_52338:126-677(+)